MTNTDMVVWRANGGSSVQEDKYSTGTNTPSDDAPNAYTTTFTQSGGFVDFVSTRALDGGGGANKYTAQLDVDFQCISAYQTTSDMLM